MENFFRSEYWQVVSDGIMEPNAGAALTVVQRIELEGQRQKDLKAKDYLGTILCKDTYLGFREEASRFCKSKKAAASSTSYGIRKTLNELRRIGYRLFLSDNGNCEQDADPW